MLILIQLWEQPELLACAQDQMENLSMQETPKPCGKEIVRRRGASVPIA